MRSSFLTVLSVLPFLSPAQSITAAKQYNFDLVSANVAPDGFTRSAALVNGQFPGPVITANKGQDIRVTVNNKLSDPSMRRSSSIHWHGIFQHFNTQDDGAAFVSQCPIAPGHNYTYFIETSQQAGTFWYHSHLSTQYIDGIRGALVIYDPNDPQKGLYDVDDESTIITLGDWWHGAITALFNEFEAGNLPFEPVADSNLINGIGRFGTTASGLGPPVTRARINVTKGKRYRLRVISISAESYYDFSIQGHSLTVIELDGIAYQPYVVDVITVLPGQRASLILNANQPVANYWINGNATFAGFQFPPFNTNYNGSDMLAVLHYSGAPNAEPPSPAPTVLPPTATPFVEFKAKPLVPSDAPGACGPPDQTFFFNFSVSLPDGHHWLVNNQVYTPPKLPTLLEILSKGFVNQSQFDPSENVFVVKPNSVVEIVFAATQLGFPLHPIHTHGHAATIINSQSGGGQNCNNNPPIRDVIASGDINTPVVVRVRTDNPGAWFVHCHIDLHLEMGMAAVMVEDPNGLRRGEVQPNAAWDQLCSIYDALPPDLQ